MNTDVCTADGLEADTDLERRMYGVYQENVESLYYFLLRLTRGQAETAQDLLQETMLRAWRKLGELPADASVIRRWLFTVARNLAIDLGRSRQTRAEVFGVDISWAPSPGDAYEGLSDKFVLRDALRRLTPEHRTVLIEMYYNDASVAEAATRIGIPEGTVRSRSFYALRAARGILGASYEPGP